MRECAGDKEREGVMGSGIEREREREREKGGEGEGEEKREIKCVSASQIT